MKYAILTILDQTIGYRTESGSYTTKHPEAKLWDDLQDASGVASRDTAMAALEIRKKGEFFVEDTDESLVCSVTRSRIVHRPGPACAARGSPP